MPSLPPAIRRLGLIATAAATITCGRSILPDEDAPGPLTGASLTSAIGRVELTWRPVLQADSYFVYYASEGGLTPQNYETKRDGNRIKTPVSAATISGLATDRVWTFVIAAIADGSEGPASAPLTGIPVKDGYTGIPPSVNIGWSYTGPPQSQFGWAVQPAGDVNGDGFADVLIDALRYNGATTNSGRVYLFLGTAGGLQANPAWMRAGAGIGGTFGLAMAAADVNGDGRSDVFVGEPYETGGVFDAGRAYLFLASNGTYASAPAWTRDGISPNARLGASIAAVDANGDGQIDALVGAPFEETAPGIDRGRAYLFLGSAGRISNTPSWIYEPPGNQSYFGSGVAGVDLDGDGRDEILVGAENYTDLVANEGAVFLFQGSSGLPPLAPFWTGRAATSQSMSGYGKRVAGLGDLNGDGGEDFAVCAVQHDDGESDEGSVFLYSSGSNGTPVPGPAFHGDEIDAQFGNALSAGDVNGDGWRDFLTGAHLANAAPGGNNRGQAYLYLGGPSGIAGTPAWTLPGTQDGEQLGYGATIVGDVNGDGSDDIVIGSVAWDVVPGNNEGKASLYFGPPNRGPYVDAGILIEGAPGQAVGLRGAWVSTRAAGSASQTCRVNWGDGTIEEGFTPCSDATLVHGSHVYGSAGTFSVSVRLQDDTYFLYGESFTTARIAP